MSIAAMKKALEALGICESMLPEYHQWLSDAQYELRAAVEAAEKVERVACTCADFVTNEIGYMKAFTNLPYNTDLYTSQWPILKSSDGNARTGRQQPTKKKKLPAWRRPTQS